MPFPPAPVALAAALAARGYHEPTPVQVAVLDASLAGRDLLVSARTGSGKTVAFGLAVAPTLLGEGERFTDRGAPLALVIAPTRELALQVRTELAWLYERTDARVVSCVGGMDPRAEFRALKAGVHIVVGTPGRLCDHLDRGALDLSRLRAVVLDEADEMLDLGFREELEKLLSATPEGRRTLLFSATLPSGIQALANKYQRGAARIEAGEVHEQHADIDYKAMIVAPREREHAIVNVLRAYDPPRALVFCATRDGVGHLHSNLVERGFPAVALSGELSQNERSRALMALRDGRARLCVATDVAARGLDLPDLSLVIHADLPGDAQVFRHRSGRTGRAGKKGVSVLIVPAGRTGYAQRLCRDANIRPDLVDPPTLEEVAQADQARLERQIVENLGEAAAADEDLAVADALLQGRDARTLIAAWVAEHRRAMPAPEDLPETAELRQRRSTRQKPERAPREPREERIRDGGEPRDARPARLDGEDTPPRRPRRDEGEPRPEGIWFRVNVGRLHNADPRWLVPMLCRRGDVNKGAIGQIVVRQRDTLVEIDPTQASSFGEAAAQPDAKEPRLKIALFRR